MVEALDFQVSKADLREHRWQQTQLPEQLAADEVVLAVSAFALTANNITYAVAGESMSYWQFFPAEAGWGRIPVWGFADVLRSNCPDIEPGQRVYGYLPMSSHLLVRAGRVSERGFTDVSPHRAALPGVYNQYVQTSADPGYDPAREDMQMLFRPLFMTSFILEDFLGRNELFGARTVILTSASSKTSMGLAHLLHSRHADACTVLGLTSSANIAFVQSLGCYDQVKSYQQIGEITRAPAVIVDMAGNGAALADVHNHLDDQLKYSALVGATHWEARAGARQMAGPVPELFFAPTHIQARTRDWGPGGLQERFAEAWGSFTASAQTWIDVEHGTGPAAVEAVYQRVLEGNAPPDKGYVLSVR